MVAAKLYAHMMNGNRTLKQTEQGVILTQEDLIIQQNQQRKQYISKVKLLNFLTLMLFFFAFLLPWTAARLLILAAINLWWLIPGSILSAAVDVSSMLHQMAHDPQPAAGTGLMQGAVPGVVSMVHIADPPLETVQHHFLDTSRHVDSQWDQSHRTLNICVRYIILQSS